MNTMWHGGEALGGMMTMVRWRCHCCGTVGGTEPFIIWCSGQAVHASMPKGWRRHVTDGGLLVVICPAHDVVVQDKP